LRLTWSGNKIIVKEKYLELRDQTNGLWFEIRDTFSEKIKYGTRE